MKCYIGYDHGERPAVEVARLSLSEFDLEAELVSLPKLVAQRLITRVADRRGQTYDMVSSAKQSTDFAISRFLVPIICQQRWALFTDCDVVFFDDPRGMLHEIEFGKAVYVVKHDYVAHDIFKMVNLAQQPYPRKNWSSVMLFDCQHPANWRLSLRDINERRGIDLHQFYWLHEDEIGALDPRWNWLVGEQELPAERPSIAHFTLGGPWLRNWSPHEYDDIWLAEANRLGVTYP